MTPSALTISGAALQQLVGDSKLVTENHNYILAKVSLIRAGCPLELRSDRANSAEKMPIVIQRNRTRLGKVAAGRYYPPLVIVAGAARRAVLLDSGVTASWVWIECGALAIPDADVITSSQLLTGLQSALCAKHFGPTRKPITGQAWPTIQAVFPLENYLIYSIRGSHYKQSYELHPEERQVVLTACGTMQPVQTGTRYAVGTVRAPFFQQHTGGRSSELLTQVVRNWGNIQGAVNAYLDAIKNGLHKPMRPSFSPVDLTSDGKISAALAAHGIELFDFARWSAKAQHTAAQKKPAVLRKTRHAV